MQTGKAAAALAEFDQSIKADPSLVEAHWLRALALGQLRRLDEADRALLALRRLHPTDPDICQAHSEILLQLGRADDMCRAVADGLQLAPAHFSLVHQRVQCARLTGDYTAAVAFALRALALQPNAHAARLEIAMLMMLTGSWREALGFYDARHNGRQVGGRHWLGERTSERVNVLREQGLGDTLQACRHFPQVAALAPATTFVVQPELHRLLARNFPALTIVPSGTVIDNAPYFAWCMDLPGILEGEAGAAAVPYLRPAAERVAAWSARLPTDRLKIGLVWQGSPTHRHNAYRSRSLDEFAPLAATEGITLVSLQPVPLPEGTTVPILSFAGDIRDFEDTAALIAAVDLVITVDTSVAHLAGAMGKTTWLLLQRPYDFRWRIEGERSELYPSMALVRDATVGQLCDRLRGFTASRRPAP